MDNRRLFQECQPCDNLCHRVLGSRFDPVHVSHSSNGHLLRSFRPRPYARPSAEGGQFCRTFASVFGRPGYISKSAQWSSYCPSRQILPFVSISFTLGSTIIACRLNQGRHVLTSRTFVPGFVPVWYSCLTPMRPSSAFRCSFHQRSELY